MTRLFILKMNNKTRQIEYKIFKITVNTVQLFSLSKRFQNPGKIRQFSLSLLQEVDYISLKYDKD